MQIPDAIAARAAEFTAVRRDLHAHPELAFAEHRTAERVASLLAEWGIEVHRGIGGTGVVGALRAGGSRRALGLRADMDALPIAEANAFAHASRHPGRMHACGHDGHTAMLLAAACHLAATRRFDGTVYFVFQPAEEGDGGASRMIADGLFERFPMDAIFGAHNWPGLPAGTFAVSPGAMMASCNEFRIEVRGRGGHAALPDLAVDPVPVACQIVQSLQTVVARSVPPHESAVLSVTNVHAGDTLHVIPDVATLGGTVRTYADATTDLVERRLREIVAHTAAAGGATAGVQFRRDCPPTVNTPDEAEFVRRTLAAWAGPDAVRGFVPAMTAEDFSWFLRAKRGCYFMIGNGDGAHRADGHALGPCTLHNPTYDFNDALIPIGAAAWTRLAEAWLAPGGAGGR